MLTVYKGLLDLTVSSYLIAISGRELVAHIHRKPIYLINEVSIIPLASQQEAQRAISKAVAKQAKYTHADSDASDTSDDESATGPGSVADDAESSVLPIQSRTLGTPDVQASPGLVAKSTSFVSDIIKDRGKYGRFADSWFSTAGWASHGYKSQGMSPRPSSQLEQIQREQRQQGLQKLSSDGSSFSPSRAGVEMVDMTTDGRKSAAQSGDDDEKSSRAVQEVMRNLVPRILSTTKLFFASKSFYFAYDYDLTRSLTGQRPASSSAPFYRDVDPAFAWNKHLIKPFADAGQYSFALPIVQGFIGQRAFTVARSRTADDEPNAYIDAKLVNADNTGPRDQQAACDSQDFLLTIVSRRSANRAGLRYLRRGVDDHGNVANYVETEQILSSSDGSADQTPSHSLMQVRGSIPLFFSQSPYSFKPIPITYGSEATNKLAFDRHFSMLQRRFGRVAVNSLVDKHATEAPIGELYQHHVELANKSASAEGKLGFEWFDFHHACRGMKFENVSQLVDILQPTIDNFGWSESEGTDGTSPVRQQQGVMRTNCMDCLDRTNVVQCAIAGVVLQKQLTNLGFAIDLKSDTKTQWFNGLWADNGDAISRQYAGTAALKGDYTRTRKRAWTGALSDFSLTLHRFYNNMLGDYFLQTCIDYYQGGNQNSQISPAQMFVDFETDMMTSDHAMDMTRLRQSAIDTCVKIVLENPDKEDLIWAWTLAAPSSTNEPNHNIQGSLEECVVLLTDSALYKIQFDWSTEKPGRFERVDLQHITGLQRGVYITNTLGSAHVDEARNQGFLIIYQNSEGDAPLTGQEIRTNTRSLTNDQSAASADSSPGPAATPVDADLARGSAEKSNDDFQSTIEATATVSAGQEEGQCVLAFKALAAASPASRSQTPSTSRRTSAVGIAEQGASANMSELETVHFITEEIRRLAVIAKRKAGHVNRDGSGETQLQGLKVDDRDIVSVAQAKSRTTYIESLGYSIKKFVWS